MQIKPLILLLLFLGACSIDRKTDPTVEDLKTKDDRIEANLIGIWKEYSTHSDNDDGTTMSTMCNDCPEVRFLADHTLSERNKLANFLTWKVKDNMLYIPRYNNSIYNFVFSDSVYAIRIYKDDNSLNLRLRQVDKKYTIFLARSHDKAIN